MTIRSAGILLYRQSQAGLEVLLAHPGGPYYHSRDLGVWTLPKGEYSESEPAQEAAKREFQEETGFSSRGLTRSLGQIRQRSGKIVSAFALEGDFDTKELKSQTFNLEWPPRSKRIASFPEVDRAEWFTLDAARQKLIPDQLPFIDRLLKILNKHE